MRHLTKRNGGSRGAERHPDIKKSGAGARSKHRAPRSPGYPATGEHAQVSSFQDQPDRMAVSMLTHLRAAARRLLPHGEVILFYRIRPCLSRGDADGETPRPRCGAAALRRARAFSRIGGRVKRFFAHEWGTHILFYGNNVDFSLHSEGGGDTIRTEFQCSYESTDRRYIPWRNFAIFCRNMSIWITPIF